MLSPPLKALLEGAQPSPWKPPAPDTAQGQRDILRGLREGDYKPWLLAEHLHGDGAFVLKAMTANGLALSYATQELKADRDFVLAALHSAGAEAEAAWDYVAKELKSNAEVVAAAVRWSPEVLQKAPEALRGSRNFVKRLVRETKASWLLEWATEELRNDVALRKECQELAGTGVVFTYYQSCNAFEAMRYSFKASGASVPGGEAYEAVMKELREAAHGSAPAAKRLPAFRPCLGLATARSLQTSRQGRPS